MANQFRTGQLVRLRRSRPYGSVADGEFKIIRQLPERDGELQYQVKSAREPHERVVMESELEKA